MPHSNFGSRGLASSTTPIAASSTHPKRTVHVSPSTVSEDRCPGGVINPYDNAHVESFFKTLKHEEILANNYSTIDDVANRLPHFLEEVYNRRRLHSSLGYMPPEEFEGIHAA